MNKERYIIDIETDGIKATKIHCLSFSNIETGIVCTITKYEDIIEFFSDGKTLIGHNIVRYDILVVEKLLGINIKNKLIDTLPISWYISPERNRHGLESYGEDFGVEKPKISDWENLSVEDYIHRCEMDVRINSILWGRQYRFLMELYEESEKDVNRILNYLSFKMDCVAEQERIGIKLDVPHASRMLSKLQEEKEIKMIELTKAMPKVPIISLKTAPKVAVRKGGGLSVHGEAWKALLEEKNLPSDYDGEVEVIKGYEDANPNSHDQLKKWLYGLGWIPEHIKHVRDKKKGTIKQIPQIASREGGGEICDSIKKLIEKEPKLELLSGLSVLSHRISIFSAFLEDAQDGILYPTIAGLTNTLRMQHKTIVNLPGPDKKYGKEVRACLIPFEGCQLLGSDLANIEDRTKRHYIYPYDPQYVKDMDVPGYDAHLEIAILAGFLTEEQAEAHKSKKEDYTAIRQKAKITNFSATYKVGAAALSRNSGMKFSEAQKLLRIYWERNKAILKVESNCKVREVRGTKWLLNPVSGYWYNLRSDKDKFSTLNQGTAAYVFDIWLTYIRRLGMKINFQYHDEFVANILCGEEEKASNIVAEAIRLTNEKLKLNIDIGCSIHYGLNYSKIH